jgi:hypothetical protein
MRHTGTLDEKCVGTPYTFIDNCLHFTIAETRELRITERRVIMLGNALREFSGGGAGEEFYLRHWNEFGKREVWSEAHGKGKKSIFAKNMQIAVILYFCKHGN